MSFVINNNPLFGPGVLVADNVGAGGSVGFNLRNEFGNTVSIEVCDDNSSWVAINSANVFRAGGAAVGAATLITGGAFYVVTDNAYLRLRVSTFAGGVVELVSYEATTFDPRTDALYLPNNTKTTATGTTSAGATLLNTSGFADVNSVAAGTGVRLPAETAKGKVYTVRNKGANALLIYPPTGAYFDLTGITDGPMNLPVNYYAQFNLGEGGVFRIMDHGQGVTSFPI